jgi:hypothetical protein
LINFFLNKPDRAISGFVPDALLAFIERDTALDFDVGEAPTDADEYFLLRGFLLTECQSEVNVAKLQLSAAKAIGARAPYKKWYFHSVS